MIRRCAKDVLIFFLWYPVRYLVSLMPLSLIPGFGRLLGLASFALGGRKRELMLEELGKFKHGGGDRGIAREAFVLQVMNDLEVFMYPRMNRKVMEKMTKVERKKYLDAGLEKGRGAILLIAHFGQNQMIMPAFGRRGYHMNQISASPVVWKDIMGKAATPMMIKSFQLRWELESNLPVRHIDVFEFLRPAFRCLKRNEVLGLAIDGGGGRRKAPFDFLDRKALFSLEPMALSVKTGASVLPTFVLRERGGRHRIVVHEPMRLRDSGDKEADLMANTQAFIDILDGYVRRYPEHYINFIVFRRLRGGFDNTYLFED